ncbi:unnamed protein product, partial [Amoebophrya sp. A25]
VEEDETAERSLPEASVCSGSPREEEPPAVVTVANEEMARTGSSSPEQEDASQHHRNEINSDINKDEFGGVNTSPSTTKDQMHSLEQADKHIMDAVDTGSTSSSRTNKEEHQEEYPKTASGKNPVRGDLDAQTHTKRKAEEIAYRGPMCPREFFSRDYVDHGLLEHQDRSDGAEAPPVVNKGAKNLDPSLLIDLEFDLSLWPVPCRADLGTLADVIAERFLIPVL